MPLRAMTLAVSRLWRSPLVLVFLWAVAPTVGAAEATFRRGEVDDDGSLGLNDALSILSYQFLGADIPCLDAADIGFNG